MLEPRLSELMGAALDGDSLAYRAVLEVAGRRLKAYFGRRLGGGRPADAEDLTQETLLAIHQRRATYDRNRPFSVWLHAIARYKLVDHFRKNKLRITIPIEDADEFLSEDPEEAAAARLDIDRLLAQAPERTAALIRSVRLEGRSIEETAAAAGMSQAAVKVAVHRGVKALAAKMKGRDERGDV